MDPRPESGLTRRSMIAGTAAAAGLTLAGGLPGESALAAPPSEANRVKATTVKTYSNTDFYDQSGTFQAEKAKQAYSDMFRRFGYSLSEPVQKGMWILEFGLGDFAHVGMAGIFWLNRQDYGYFGHEIYLLPGQMIPEHSHWATDKGPAKMESWHVRHGMIHTFGEGDLTPEVLLKVPASQRDLIKSRHGKPLLLDEVADLNRREAWHFMVAGPEGALVTEYGTFHDAAGLRFSNPKAKL